jgi:uncharacterized repeat protein (TIGR01451 family)
MRPLATSLFLLTISITNLQAVVAEMIINEVMYKQQGGSAADDNDEFVEFYVTQAGDIDGYIFTDQDSNSCHLFTFPHQNVVEGDYVILHLGTATGAGDSTTRSKGYHFDANKSRLLNNKGDDVVLLKPSTTDTTNLYCKKTASSGGAVTKTVNAIPVDYIAYGTKNGKDKERLDDPPTSSSGVTVNWDTGNNANLGGAAKGRSISLSVNGVDGDTSYCWELTESGDANNSNCPAYKPTLDTNINSNDNGDNYICSGVENNNGMPNMSITKTSIVLSDPVNGSSNPKRIPGATIRYCFSVINDGNGTAENPEIKDTLTGNNRDKLTYTHPNAGKGSVVNNTDACTASDCTTLTDTSSSSYNNSTKKITISLDDIPANSHQCAYIDVTIQ